MIVVLGSHLADALGDEPDPKTLAESEMTVTQQRRHSRSQMGDAPLFVDHGHRERDAPDRGVLPDAPQKAQVLAATAERNVLAVVGRRGRIALPLRKCLNGAAERRPPLEQGHRRASVDEIERRRQTGEPAPDHHCPHYAASRMRPLPITRSLPNAERLGRAEKTS